MYKVIQKCPCFITSPLFTDIVYVSFLCLVLGSGYFILAGGQENLGRWNFVWTKEAVQHIRFSKTVQTLKMGRFLFRSYWENVKTNVIKMLYS